MIFSLIKQIVRHVNVRVNPAGYLEGLGVKVGKRCRFYSLHPGAFGSEPYLVEIGDDVTITAGVRIITHDGSTFLFRQKHPKIDVMGPVTIGNNTFIGMNSIIMPGVKIGDNCIVGAMSVVTRSVPSGSVIAGNPAKVITTTQDFENKLLERSSETGHLGEEEKKTMLLNMNTVTDSSGRKWKCKP
ncbi:acyltransferase [Pseudoalteromonas sp. T1lg22]|uniref:acyltransferase n=1 Tax=Pseudoalteromonas sp. T1lg22 TaxID=2077096 RepID=UPI000CF63786|nr:acyltransferase [Pseudoalteromonas sp. T1lg22]